MNTLTWQRLRALPEVFTRNDMAAIHFDGDKNKASVYLSRWKKMGLVTSFGSSGVYFNLLRNPDAARDGSLTALGLLFPEAVIIGASALHDVGWTTQIPMTTDVAVKRRASYPAPPGFNLHPRSVAWFRTMHDYIDLVGFPRLSPDAALADAWLHAGMWHPDLDDLESDEIDVLILRETFIRLKVAWPSQYELLATTKTPHRRSTGDPRSMKRMST